MRKNIVAGNWKMNKDLSDGLKLTSEILHMVNDEVHGDTLVVIAPPFLHLTSVNKMIGDSDRIFLGAQNCYSEESGAFTGEISASMLSSAEVEYVIIGHSERRQYFDESNDLLSKKVDQALTHGLIPIFCCGESLEIREKGEYVKYVTNQIDESLFHLTDKEFGKIVIAYEPIWAIGTGLTASSEQAQEMHAALRQYIAGKYGSEIAESVTILYGGSCKPSNAQELFACEDVDGGLIGGASLSSRDFVDIIKSF